MTAKRVISMFLMVFLLLGLLAWMEFRVIYRSIHATTEFWQDAFDDSDKEGLSTKEFLEKYGKHGEVVIDAISGSEVIQKVAIPNYLCNVLVATILYDSDGESGSRLSFLDIAVGGKYCLLGDQAV